MARPANETLGLRRNGSVQSGTSQKVVFGLMFLLLGFLPSSLRAIVTTTVGPNVNISAALGNNAEQSIAINPTNPNNLFASETIAGVSKFSVDGGLTWHNSNLSAAQTPTSTSGSRTTTG